MQVSEACEISFTLTPSIFPTDTAVSLSEKLPCTIEAVLSPNVSFRFVNLFQPWKFQLLAANRSSQHFVAALGMLSFKRSIAADDAMNSFNDIRWINTWNAAPPASWGQDLPRTLRSRSKIFLPQRMRSLPKWISQVLRKSSTFGSVQRGSNSSFSRPSS